MNGFIVLIQGQNLCDVKFGHCNNKRRRVLCVGDWEDNVLMLRRVEELWVQIDIVLPENVLESEGFRWVMRGTIMMMGFIFDVFVFVFEIVLVGNGIMSLMNACCWVEKEGCGLMSMKMIEMDSEMLREMLWLKMGMVIS